MRIDKLINIFCYFLIIFFFSYCAQAKGKQVVVQGSASIPMTGMTIDASYDEKLDTLIEGCKIVNVAVTNSSLNLIGLDPAHDKWWLVDKKGKKHRAMIDLRSEKPDSWEKLDDRLKKMLGYPLMIPIGGTTNIDLFFAGKYDLHSFKAIIFDSYHFGQSYKVMIFED